MKILKNKRDEKTFRIIIPLPLWETSVHIEKIVEKYNRTIFESEIRECKNRENTSPCLHCPGFIKPPWSDTPTCLGFRSRDGEYHLYFEQIGDNNDT